MRSPQANRSSGENHQRTFRTRPEKKLMPFCRNWETSRPAPSAKTPQQPMPPKLTHPIKELAVNSLLCEKLSGIFQGVLSRLHSRRRVRKPGLEMVRKPVRIVRNANRSIHQGLKARRTNTVGDQAAAGSNRLNARTIVCVRFFYRLHNKRSRTLLEEGR